MDTLITDENPHPAEITPAPNRLNPNFLISRLGFLLGSFSISDIVKLYLAKEADPINLYSKHLGSSIWLRPRQFAADLATYEEVYYKGTYRFPHDILDALRSNFETVTFIDLGANTGLAALSILDQLKKAGTTVVSVVAIEPEEGNFEVMSLNLKGTGVRCEKAAIGHEPGQVVLDRGLGSRRTAEFRTGPISAEMQRKADVVDVITMDDVLETLAGTKDSCNIVKCDIEGAEVELLEQDPQWLDKVHVLFIESHTDTLNVDFANCHRNLIENGLIPVGGYRGGNDEDRLYVRGNLIPEEVF